MGLNFYFLAFNQKIKMTCSFYKEFGNCNLGVPPLYTDYIWYYWYFRFFKIKVQSHIHKFGNAYNHAFFVCSLWDWFLALCDPRVGTTFTFPDSFFRQLLAFFHWLGRYFRIIEWPQGPFSIFNVKSVERDTSSSQVLERGPLLSLSRFHVC